MPQDLLLIPQLDQQRTALLTRLAQRLDGQLPVFSAQYPPGHAPGKGLQSLVGAPLPGDVRGRSGH